MESQSGTRKLISSPIKKGQPFLPSASTVRRLPSVVESPIDNHDADDVKENQEIEKLEIARNNSQVPIITDSCLKRKLTKEEEDLNIQNCDNDEIEDNDCDTNETGTNNNRENPNLFTHLNNSSSNGNNGNPKEWKIIENLKKGELFEDPNFPAAPKSLFYRYKCIDISICFIVFISRTFLS